MTSTTPRAAVSFHRTIVPGRKQVTWKGDDVVLGIAYKIGAGVWEATLAGSPERTTVPSQTAAGAWIAEHSGRGPVTFAAGRGLDDAALVAEFHPEAVEQPAARLAVGDHVRDLPADRAGRVVGVSYASGEGYAVRVVWDGGDGVVRQYSEDYLEKLCDCGKDAAHLAADEDSSEWACRVPAPAAGPWAVEDTAREEVPGGGLLWHLTRDGEPTGFSYGSRVYAVDSMLERNADHAATARDHEAYAADVAEAEARLEEARARHDRSRRGEFVRTRLLTAMRALASDDGRLLADASIDLLTAARHLLSDREEADGPRTPTAFRLSVEDRDRLKLIGARFGNPDEASALRHVVRLVADLIEAGQGGRR